MSEPTTISVAEAFNQLLLVLLQASHTASRDFGLDEACRIDQYRQRIARLAVCFDEGAEASEADMP